MEINLNLKFIDIKENRIDPNKLRNKNFFKGIFKDRKKNFNNLSDLIIRGKIRKCPLCKSKKIENKFLKITTSYYLNKCNNCFLIFPNTNFNTNKNYTKRVYSKFSKQNHRKILKRCRMKKNVPKDGYCYQHKDQAPVGHSQNTVQELKGEPMPPLRDWHEDPWQEPLLDGEEMACLIGIHRGWDKVDEYALELFKEWPDAWKRRWL